MQLYGHWLEPGLLFPIKPLQSFTPNNLSAPFKRFSLGRQLQRASLPGRHGRRCGNSIRLLHGGGSALLLPAGRASPGGDTGTRGHRDTETRGHRATRCPRSPPVLARTRPGSPRQRCSPAVPLRRLPVRRGTCLSRFHLQASDVWLPDTRSRPGRRDPGLPGPGEVAPRAGCCFQSKPPPAGSRAPARRGGGRGDGEGGFSLRRGT